MKTTLPKKSYKHAKTIFSIRDKILEKHQDKISHIILYGSFARGGWIHDIDNEEGYNSKIVGYFSNYDIFIIAKEHLEYLISRVEKLKEAVKKVCSDKINSFDENTSL